MMRVFKKIILLFLLTFILSGCTDRGNKVITETGYYLGTIVKISIYDKAPDNIFTEVFSLISDLENTLSRNIDESEISIINRNSGLKSVKVSDDTFSILENKYARISNGKFDFTIGPLVSLWGIGTESAGVPELSEIADALKLVNSRNLLLDRENQTVFLTKKGMEIDAGAAAKGYIADRVSDYLKNKGIKSAIINLGGNILTIGTKPDGRLFRIGIQDPDDTRGEYIGIAELDNKSLVTSGIYERYFEENGRKYHHILDPETGFPVENNILGISVITENSVDGDVLSTTLFLMGIDKGLEYAEKKDGIEVLFISDKREIFMTEGFSRIFKLSSSKYKISE